MAIKTSAIKKLWEADPTNFKTNLKEAFGVKESYGGTETIDPQASRDLDNLTTAGMARDFIGEDYQNILGGKNGRLLNDPFFFSRITESEGGPITASLMTPINLFSAGVLGLYEAKVLAGYNLPQFAFRELSIQAPTSVPGGHKHIRPSYSGEKPVKALAELESATSAGATAAWIWTQSTETHQHLTSITLEGMLSSISGDLQEKAMTIGMAAAFNENDRFFDRFYGRVNEYCYNGATNIPNCDTYLASAAGDGYLASGGAAPFNFTNLLQGSANYKLTDTNSLQAAWILLNQNYDPGTGWRFVPDKNLKLVVAPDYIPMARKIKGQLASQIRQGDFIATTTQDPTGAGSTAYRTESYGPATQYLDFSFDVVDATYLATDRASNGTGVHAVGGPTTGSMAAVTAANSKLIWHLMSPKTWEYQVLTPLQTRTFPITGQEMKKRIVFQGDALVMSRFVCIDPRHSCMVLPF
jgi:hypothetical protein